jgi:hypothetical protein
MGAGHGKPLYKPERDLSSLATRVTGGLQHKTNIIYEPTH